MTDIERISTQIKHEIHLDQEGRGFISIRGAARLADVKEQTLSTHFRGDSFSSSKLAQQLIEQGFKPDSFSLAGIPDIALSVILGYYAMDAGKRCTEQAKLAYKAFSAIGIRAWMQQITGYSNSATSPKISAEFAVLADEFFGLIGETHILIHRWADFARRLNEEIKTVRKTAELERYADQLQKMLEIVNGVITLGTPATQVERSLVSAHMANLIEEKFIANSTQTGCLERYVSKKPNKAGVVVEYPKINATTRDESIDSDWWWRYKYSVKDPETGKWVARSTSVSLEKLGAVRAAIALDATLPMILRLIEEPVKQ